MFLSAPVYKSTYKQKGDNKPYSNPPISALKDIRYIQMEDNNGNKPQWFNLMSPYSEWDISQQPLNTKRNKNMDEWMYYMKQQLTHQSSAIFSPQCWLIKQSLCKCKQNTCRQVNSNKDTAVGARSGFPYMNSRSDECTFHHLLGHLVLHTPHRGSNSPEPGG